MDRKKELRMQWKERKTVAGVFQIKNLKNHKTLVESTRNITDVNRQKFMLEYHAHPNKSLQADWNQFGADAFSFEVLEVLEKEPDEYYDVKDTLKKLKEKWVQQLESVGDQGGNGVRIRQ